MKKKAFNAMNMNDIFTFAVGIDNGTSRGMSACAAVNMASSPTVASLIGVNAGGVPSLFWVKKVNENGRTVYKIVVGDDVAAEDALIEDPKNVCTSVKTKLNEKEIVLNGQSFPPNEIMAEIVNKMYDVSRNAFKSDCINIDNSERIVAGVPVRFTSRERANYKRAIEEGLRIARKGKPFTLYLYNESTLAAMAVVHKLNEVGIKDRSILLIDIGAGTTDTDYLTKNKKLTPNNPYPYISHNADGCEVAGNRFDEAMCELIIGKLRAINFPIELFDDKRGFNYLTLLETAREMKERLSFKASVNKLITAVDGQEKKLGDIVVKREEYEKAIEPLVRSIIEAAKRTASAVKDDDDYDVVLVGGSANIPMIQAEVAAQFNREVHVRMPEKAVAYGAALAAADPGIVMPRVFYGYGVESFDPITDEKVIQVVLPSNRGEFCVKGEGFRYHTKNDKQTKLSLPIYEIRGDLENSEKSGATFALSKTSAGVYYTYKFTYKFGEPVDKGTGVSVTLELDESGILTVSAARVDHAGKVDETTWQHESYDLSYSVPETTN